MKLLDFSQYLMCTEVACQLHLCMFCTVHLLSLRAAISAQALLSCYWSCHYSCFYVLLIEQIK